MSWLGDLWDRNRNSIGNAVKNISPALAFVPGLGIAGAFAGGALGRAAQKGTNIGDILKSGVSNAAIGGGARSLVGAGRAAFTPSSSTAASPGTWEGVYDGAHAPEAAYQAASGDGLALKAPPITTPIASSSGFGNSARALGGFAKDNATVLGQVGSGVLNARAGDEANALKTRQLDFEQQQYLDEQQRKKNLAALLGPLAQQIMSQQRTVAPNPYTSH